MRAKILIFSIMIINFCWGQNSPTNIMGLQLWLSSDSVLLNAGSVQTWYDKSGNDHHAIQNTAINQPLLINNISIINSKPVIYFDGDNDILTGAPISGIENSSLTIFVVANGVAQPGNAAELFAMGDFTNGFWFGRHISLEKFRVYGNNDGVFTTNNSMPGGGFNYTIWEAKKAMNSNLDLYVNGILNGSTAGAVCNSFTNNTYYSIGCAPGYQCFKGNVAEVILYNRALSDNERQQVEQYIRDKYAPPINLGPDIIVNYGFCPVTINASGNYTKYEWSNGATTSSISIQDTNNYFLTVTDIFGFKSVDSIHVNYPKIHLSSSDTIICLGDTISISTTLSSITGYSFLWSNSANTPSINIYNPASISVTVSDTLLCPSHVSNTIAVSIDSLPIKISLGPDKNLCSGNTISLTNYPENPNGLSFLWSDYSTDSLLVVDSSGDYVISVTNQRGCIGSDTIHINIVGTAPSVNFFADTVCLGDTTHFINSSSHNYDSLLWNFGDGQYDTVFNPNHTYLNQDTYEVTLYIALNSCSSQLQKTITVKPKPISNFNYTNSCFNQPVVYTNNSSPNGCDSISSYLWDFAGLDTSTLTNPTYTFSSGGNFNVTLFAFANNGCDDSITKTINTVTTAPLPILSLYTPANNNQVSNTNILFSWIATNAISYILQISSDNSFGSLLYSDTLTNTQKLISLNLSNNQSVYWKVIAFNYCMESISSPINVFNYFSPNNLNGNVLWLSSDSVLIKADSVKTWYDKSGNGYHAIQNTAINQPLLINNVSIINSKPVIYFDGDNDILTGTSITGIGNSSLTIFVVANGIAQSGNASELFAMGDFTNGFWFGRHISLEKFRVYGNSDGVFTTNKSMPIGGFNYTIWEAKKTINSGLDLYVNGILNVTATGTPVCNLFTNTDYSIGNKSGSAYYKGNIAEVILYNRALPENERQQVEQYIRDKYAPPVNLGSDIYSTNFCPITINAQNRFVKYIWSTTSFSSGDTLSEILVKNSGQYSVTVTDVFGFTSIDTIAVYMPFNKINDSIICPFTSIEINTGLSHIYDFIWSTNSTDSVITISNQGQYWINITDSLHCSILDSFYISIDSFPVLASLGPDISLCSGNSISLISGDNEVTNYLWNNNSTNSSLVIHTTGNYWVSATNSRGCTATDTIHVNITGIAPIPGFTVTNTCFGDKTIFTDTSHTIDGSTIFAWKWIIGQDTLFTQNISEIFTATGTYNAQLTVSTDSNCSNTIIKKVIIHPKPKATYDIEGICNGSTSYFTNTTTISEGSIASIYWHFGDNSTSTILNPQHTFSGVGNYQVQLIAESNSGCIDSFSKNIEIKPSPVAGYDFSPVCSGYSTYFFDTSQVLPIFHIIEWHWDFGDLSTSNQQSPKHIYSSAGDYYCSLIIKSLNGCSDTIIKSITVSAPPIANFIGDSTCFGSPLTFNDVSTGNIYKWKWLLNNINISSVQNPEIDFSNSGNFQLKLIVTSNVDCTDSVSKTISVYPLPDVGFSISSTIGPPGVIIVTTNHSSYGQNYWQFGDNQSSQLVSPSHTYTDTGSYTIWLKVEDIHGCNDSTSHIIKVVPKIYDLAIIAVEVAETAGFISIKADIANLGTMPINNPSLVVNSDKHTPVMEIYPDTIISGKIINYQFISQLPVSEVNTPLYVCVKGSLLTGLSDIDLTNNEACEIIKSEGIILNLYPNPSSSGINIELNISIPGKSLLKIYDKAGHIITQNELELSSGFNRIIIDVKDYAKGKYNIQLKAPEGSESIEFVKY